MPRTGNHPITALLLLLGLTPASLYAQPEEPAQEPTKTPAEPVPDRSWPPVHGQLSVRYRGRWTESEHDNDLYGFLDATAGDDTKDLLTARISGRVAWDLDRDRAADHAFRSIDDTYGKDINARVYSAYLDINGVDGNPAGTWLRRVRLGRQILYETPETLFLDGGSLQTQPARSLGDLVLHAFAGIPNHLFETSAEGDLALGAALSARPWEGASARLDYVHVEDSYLGSTSQDDLYGVRLDQRIGSELYLNGHVNLLGSAARDMSAAATWTDADADRSLTLRYTALLSDQTTRSIDFDYFTTVAKSYFAYDQYEIHAHQGLGGGAFLDGGVQLRELREDANEGLLNHEFRRYFLAPGVAGWPHRGTTLQLTVEHWHAGDDRFTTLGGEIEQELGDDWTLSLGTAFDLFRYDALRQTEDENVQQSYLRLLWRATETLRLRSSLSFEDGEQDDYATLMVAAEVRL